VPLAPTVTNPLKVFIPVKELTITAPVVAPFPITVFPLILTAVVKALRVNDPRVAVRLPVIVVVPDPVNV